MQYQNDFWPGKDLDQPTVIYGVLHGIQIKIDIFEVYSKY